MIARFKRFYLLAMLALTGLAAVITASAVVRGGRSPEAMEWALKCATGVGFMLLVSFGAIAALERRFWRWPAIVGMSLAALMLLLVPIYIWWEIATRGGAGPVARESHLQVQRVLETGLLSAGLLCTAAFTMAPRMKRVGLIAQYTTVLYLTIAFVSVLMWVWNVGGERVEDGVVRLIIPAGACLMGVFVLQKFFEIKVEDPLRAVSAVIHVRCPRCQREQELPEGNSQCATCRLRFSITVEEPRCPNCGFNLHLLTRPICPECGMHLDQKDVPLTPDPAHPPKMSRSASFSPNE